LETVFLDFLNLLNKRKSGTLHGTPLDFQWNRAHFKLIFEFFVFIPAFFASKRFIYKQIKN